MSSLLYQPTEAFPQNTGSTHSLLFASGLLNSLFERKTTIQSGSRKKSSSIHTTSPCGTPLFELESNGYSEINQSHETCPLCSHPLVHESLFGRYLFALITNRNSVAI